MAKKIVGVNDLATTHPHLLAEWDYEANIIKPTDVTKGSAQIVAWKCSKGHKWSARISNRATLGQNCPFCAGKSVFKGYNDLATIHPELLNEWDYDENEKLGIKPDEVLASKKIHVNWICSECGEKYVAPIKEKVNKKALCPNKAFHSSSNDGNSLADTNPELLDEWDYRKKLDEWDYEKNKENGIYPTNVTAGCGKKVWWKCSKGHSYEMLVNSKVLLNYGCPICSNKKIVAGINDLATTRPEVMSEWDYEKNNKIGLYPTQVSQGSGKDAWWTCEHGHSYKTKIMNKKKKGCPVCSGRTINEGVNDLATTHPELLNEWDYDENEKEGLTPQNCCAGSQKYAHWICKHGHKWEAQIVSRAELKSNCPICFRHRVSSGSHKNHFEFSREFSELMKEWNCEKNNEIGLDPNMLTGGSSETAWWKCPVCNAEWRARINERTMGRFNCPNCKKI